MVTLRLARIGKRKHPTYRIVVSDKRKDTLGPFLEQLGTYDPHAATEGVKLNADRIHYWLGMGATASASVHNLLVGAKLLNEKTVPMGAAKKAAAAEGKATPTEVAKPAAPSEPKVAEEQSAAPAV